MMKRFWEFLQAFFNYRTSLKQEPVPVPQPVPQTTTGSPPSPTVTTGRPADLPESNHYATRDFSILKKEYDYLYPLAFVNKPGSYGLVAALIANQHRYEAVAAKTGVPWQWIAAIHYREASLNFGGAFHNGDQIIGTGKKTTHVPAGRGPFATWEESAVDALKLEGLFGLNDWSLSKALWRAEGYNGWGYRINDVHDFVQHEHHSNGAVRIGTKEGTYHGSMQDTVPRNASPYIFNGTQFYRSGISIEDHSFYPEAIDDQLGVMAIFRCLEQAGFELSWQGTTPSVPQKRDVNRLLTMGKTLGLSPWAVQHLIEVASTKKSETPPRYWGYVDFTQHSSKKRFHVFDIQENTFTSYLVAHGKGSEGKTDDGMADVFSNEPGSAASSVGVYQAAETYQGVHGLSCRLDGLESTNSNVRARAVVIHSADYVTPHFIVETGRAGRSEGCFAVDPDCSLEIINKLSGGSFIIAAK